MVKNSIAALLLSVASTVTTTDRVTMTTVAPTAAGQLGMDTTTGRPQMFVGGVAVAAMSTADQISQAQVDTADASGLSTGMVIRKAFTAGGGGSADDVTIYSANAPFGFRILDTFCYVTTAVAASTLTLRNATGGGGSANSDAFASSVTGVFRNITLTATSTIATNGTLVVRRSDNGVAGECIVMLQKT